MRGTTVGWMLIVALLTAPSQAVAIPVAPTQTSGDPLAGGSVVPEGLWVDDSFNDSGHFLLTGARDWTERAILWFDTQLLPAGTSYAEVASAVASRPRSETRRDVVARLQAIAAASWDRARPAIDSLVDAGSVLWCEPMWIVNGASCAIGRATDPVIFRTVPGVARVFRGMPERDFPTPPALGPRFVAEGPQAPFESASARVGWNLDALGVPRMWAEGLTGKGVGVVIHDGGFKLDAAPTIAGLWRNPGEIAGNEIDDDRNGYIDDVHGFQFDARTPAVNHPQIVRDEVVHGNAVAALAVGRQMVGSGQQIGVAPDARWAAVMAVLNFHDAVEWALAEDFDVYGMSFSYPGLGPLRSHFRKMLEHGALAGLFFVSGAGNFGDPDTQTFAPVPVQLRTPEDIPLAVLGVAGIDSMGVRPAFSSRGPVEWSTYDYQDGSFGKPDLATVNTDLAVPGYEGTQTTGVFRGNSFAAPHMVGVIALLLEEDPEVSPWTLRQILLDSARDVGALGVDSESGAGLVDAPAALARLRRLRNR